MIEERAQEELEKRGVPPGLARAAAKQGSKAGAKQLDKSTGGLIEGGRHHHHHHGLKHLGKKILHSKPVQQLKKKGIDQGRKISMGGAIGMARRVESVGAGGNLLHRHPSQMSQADSANFHFSTQFPPGLAEVRGSGLYGSGLYV